MPKVEIAKRVQGMQDNVWTQFAEFSKETGAVNLAHGFPNFPPPDFIVKALKCTESKSQLHQYTRGFGHPRLVEALAKMYSRLTRRHINPQEEVLVTAGAYEALFTAFQGLVNPGDEVIIIEPFFECYEPMTLMAGGVPVFIPLRPKRHGLISSADWLLDRDELTSKFNSRTKMIVVNTPHNPTGKVFSREELEMIAHLCRKHNVICLIDEVYEWIVYEGAKHIRMNTLPGMWERTITIGSAGKSFSVTGWKIGWAYGPRHLLRGLQLVHQTCVYALSTLLQEAIAVSLEKVMERDTESASYWCDLSRTLQRKRDFMCASLSAVGLVPTVPQAGYFLVCNFSSLAPKINLEGRETKDYLFARWLCKTKKLLGIPPGAFYSVNSKHLAQYLIRFCFAKDDSTLQKAADILMELKTL
ncbi:kynurenine aminotransferase-like [Rhipicephalus sanguineus]|uniref:kynurenine aminotransferase-like n=1 Tax=Rhipicephalus sanguineus TaxID=34632 RepID=UPI0018936077|nr:kynurenine aminotransferase-like [Rhipicephalus sanguineus]